MAVVGLARPLTTTATMTTGTTVQNFTIYASVDQSKVMFTTVTLAFAPGDALKRNYVCISTEGKFSCRLRTTCTAAIF